MCSSGPEELVELRSWLNSVGYKEILNYVQPTAQNKMSGETQFYSRQLCHSQDTAA